MKSIALSEDGYRITTHGNGLSVEVRREADGASFFLQGEDAARFRDEWDAVMTGQDFAAFLSLQDYDQLFAPDCADPAP